LKMTLALPHKVRGVEGNLAKIACGEGEKTVDASLIGGLRSGDYVLIHGGLAIQKLTREDAEETIRLDEEFSGRAKP
jgi:hydrogenase expression/formation protein HypC